MLQNRSELIAEYKYIFCDFVTDEVIAEIPLTDVSYSRNIRDAGTLSGAIPVIDDTFNLDLYGNTLPGKTSIYVLRNNVCVWGGIIWSRTYNIKERTVNINASEFISYLSHRAVWLNRNNSFSASGYFAYGVWTFTLDPVNPFLEGFKVGSSVFLSFTNDNTYTYTGFYTITDDVTPTTTTFSVGSSGIGVYGNPVGAYPLDVIADDAVGITAHADTYDYTRKILSDMNVDLYGKSSVSDFELYPPGSVDSNSFDEVTRVSAAPGGKTKVELSAISGTLTAGQGIKLLNMAQSSYNGVHKILSVDYATNSVVIDADAPTSSFNALNRQVTMKTKQIVQLNGGVANDFRTSIVTLITPNAHGFSKGNEVVVSGLGLHYDGRYVIHDVPDTKTFRYYNDYVAEKATAASGSAVVKSEMFYTTGGPYTDQSDLKFDFSTLEYSGKALGNDPKKGSDLEYFGDHLNNYSNTLKGFEYRIDPAYDPVTKRFKKTFVFMPYFPQTYTDYVNNTYGGQIPPGTTVPPYVLGADKLVFEHPGNILDLTLEESAEDAATRMWVRGNVSDVGADTSQPYVAVVATDMLEQGWPILDQTESQQNLSDPAKLLEYGKQYLDQARPPLSNFSVVVNGSMHPFIGSYNPGDWCSLVVQDDFVKSRLIAGYELGLEPRNTILVRKITSYSVSVPNSPSYPEEVTLQLITEPQVDVIGYTTQ
jgi:hypothetical protein